MHLIIDKKFKLPPEVKNKTLSSLNFINGKLYLIFYTESCQIQYNIDDITEIIDLDRNMLPFSFNMDFSNQLNQAEGIRIKITLNNLVVTQTHFMRVCKRNEISITPHQLIQPDPLLQSDLVKMLRVINTKNSIMTLCTLMKVPLPPLEIIDGKLMVGLPSVAFEADTAMTNSVEIQIKDFRKLEDVAEIVMDDALLSINMPDYSLIYGIRQITEPSMKLPSNSTLIDFDVPNFKVISDSINANIFGNAMLRFHADKTISIEVITPDGGWIRNQESEDDVLITALMEVHLVKAWLSFLKGGKGSYDVTNDHSLQVVNDGVKMCIACSITR